MKKSIISLITGAVLLGGATFVSAATNDEGEGLFNFEQMKPRMEEMHPDLSEREQEEMFDACHGENGGMRNSNRQSRHMMNF